MISRDELVAAAFDRCLEQHGPALDALADYDSETSHAGEGDIAVCVPCNNSTHKQWRVYRQHEDGKRTDGVITEFIGPAGRCDWPIIYSPEES